MKEKTLGDIMVNFKRKGKNSQRTRANKKTKIITWW
jgi:hypothetical protein